MVRGGSIGLPGALADPPTHPQTHPPTHFPREAGGGGGGLGLPSPLPRDKQTPAPPPCLTMCRSPWTTLAVYRSATHPPTHSKEPTTPSPLVVSTSPPWGLRDDRIPGTDQAVRGGRHGQKLHSGFPPRGRGMPAAVRMPPCHGRRFKGERPIGAATG